MGQSQLMKYLYLFYKQTIKSQMSQAVIFFSLDKYILAIFVGLLETISEKIILNSALQFQKIFQVSTKQQTAIQSKLLITSLVITEYSISDIILL